MSYRVGVDIGGSFADFAVFDENRKTIHTLKVFSRPDSPGSEVLDGVKLLREKYGIDPEKITYFTHGTTVGINTVIQRNGLKLALFTTENFTDVLELARLKSPDMYNLLSRRPEPLVSRDMVFGIRERVDALGTVVTPLEHASVIQALNAALQQGAEAIVISFLHAYRNAAHEQQVSAIIREIAPELPVICSSATWPIIREYERTITAVIAAYVQPRVKYYLSSLQKALKNTGIRPELHLTKSNGGIMTAELGKEQCAQMILSGTASGVIGAGYVAKTSGVEKCLSLDIGGTSADVAIILNGQPHYDVGEYIGEFQIFVPSVSVSSIGEGGGSIAWVDRFGVLKVGPTSAGSSPGPACYGLGGKKPTITDAFAVCGFLGNATLGYSAVTIDRELARQAIEPLAKQLDRSIEQTAEAIIHIALSSMYSGISALVSRFGIDLGAFACLAFGGAGPMMGCLLARDLKMKETLIPPTPGVLSALGGLIADLKNDFVSILYRDLDENCLPEINDHFNRLEVQALDWLRNEQAHDGEYEIIFSADMRYRGQSFELETPVDIQALRRGDITELARAFHHEHKKVYGHADTGADLQLIALRLIIVGQTPKFELPVFELTHGAPSAETRVSAWLDGRYQSLALYHRSALRPGHVFYGPAIIAQDDCTTIVPDKTRVTIDKYANIRVVPELI
ncbi:hydantoinase/oxoprolinase family protein [Acetobacter okinawensis]|uniref:Hydantoinase n=1 Tax=Acetobacter okinawensis TaxID=1076594 RepID=A0A252BSQ6_9PROT|nr:hydantoinase/oxoprolinase family protein [Acetobacter okinawensis]OUJ11513.1 hydantoinase [Acetobacter okinawensis]